MNQYLTVYICIRMNIHIVYLFIDFKLVIKVLE